MNTITKYIILLFLFLPGISIANSLVGNYEISGKITDAENGESLVGVSIFIPELQKGTVSDQNGTYTLSNLPKSEITIQFSFIGYETKIVKQKVINTNNILDVALQFTSVKSQEVVVSGGFPSAQHENAIKISVLDKEEIEKLSSPALGDKLSAIAGVDQIQRSPGISTPVIRGLSMNNIIFLNNGTRLENFQFSANHPFLLNDKGIDQIEVIKGPASLLYGSDAMGGVINVVSEKPAPTNQLKADVSTQYFTNTKGYNTSIGVKRSQKNWFWTLRANETSHKDYKDGSGKYVPNSRFNSQGFQLGMGLLKDIGSFKIYYDYYQPDLGMTNPNAAALVKAGNRKNRAWYQHLTQHLLSSRNKLFLGRYKWEINAAYQFNNRQLKGDPNADHFRLVDMDLKSFTYDSKLYFPSGENRELLVGIQGMHQTNKNQGAPNRIIPNANIDDFSVFTLFKQQIKKFDLQAGVRYDYRAIYAPEQEAAGHSHGDEHEDEHEEDGHDEGEHEEEHEEETIHLNQKFNHINASIGATYHINEQFIIRSNIASAYRAPNLAELSQHGQHGNRFEEGDPNLKAQKSIEADLGLHYHTTKLNVDLSAFYNRIFDYIYLSPTNEKAPEGNGFVYKYQQQNAKIYGGEASVTYSLSNHVQVASDYAYIIAKQNDGNYLPFIPHNKWNSSIKFVKFSKGIFKNSFASITNQYAFQQNHPSIYETKSDSYNIVNLQIGSDLMLRKIKSQIYLGVQNLFDKNYVDHLSALKPLGYKQMGRNFTVHVKLEL